MKKERFEELMVKVSDGVASPAEREELMAWIADKDDVQRELEAHKVLKAVTDGWVHRLEIDAFLDRQARRPLARLENILGILLVALGSVLLGGTGLLLLLRDPEIPLPIKLGTGLLCTGLLLLLGALLRRRLGQLDKDRYRDVVR